MILLNILKNIAVLTVGAALLWCGKLELKKQQPIWLGVYIISLGVFVIGFCMSTWF